MDVSIKTSSPFPLENWKTCSFVENKDQCFYQKIRNTSRLQVHNYFVIEKQNHNLQVILVFCIHDNLIVELISFK